MEVIIGHQGADFDVLASMVAVQKLYPAARMVAVGQPDPTVQEFLTLHRSHFNVEREKDVDPLEVQRIILVDTRNPSRLGRFRSRVQEQGVEVHIYDHHPATPESIQGDLEVVEPLGAAVTVILKRVVEKGLPITQLEATLYLIAIYQETGSLTYTSTTPEDLRMGALLLERGAHLEVVARFNQHGLSAEQREVFSKLLSRSDTRYFDGHTAVVASLELPKYVPELGLLTSRLLDLTEADVAATVAGWGERASVIARSRSPRCNVGAVLQELGGGGHATAASASVACNDVGRLTAHLWEVLENALGHGLTVADLMSHTVRSLELEEGLTIGEAGRRLRELGHTATVICQDGKPVGMLTRSDVDKALAHDLDHAPVQAFMTSPVLSVKPETSLRDLQRLLVERDIGRVPVLDEDGNLAGIVSRTDILRAFYHRPNESRRFAGPERPDLTSQLMALPPEWLLLLRRTGEMARQERVEVYVVGGFVRDLMLGRHEDWLDLDLVVEGDGPQFAERIAEEVGAHAHHHPRFQTVRLCLPDGRELDVATARTETYCRPAALPVVRGSTLKQDLFRRDFSINAMAVRLTAGHFGELIDFFGSAQDLYDHKIRVLHNHSFFDDPTRILRAVRFEQRLGFHIEQNTEHLLRNALNARVLQQVSPERIADELKACLQEKEPLPILRRLGQLKVLRHIHPRLQMDNRLQTLLENVEWALHEFSALRVERWRVYVRAVLYRWDKAEMDETLERYLRRFQINLGNQEVKLSKLIWELSGREPSNSRLYELLEPLSDEELILLVAMTRTSKSRRERVLRRIRFFLERLRGQRSLLRGVHLREAGMVPGPDFRRVLEEAFRVQLDEGWDQPEQALEWLRSRGRA